MPLTTPHTSKTRSLEARAQGYNSRDCVMEMNISFECLSLDYQNFDDFFYFVRNFSIHTF